MKCTLRKVDGSIVATIDERPKVGDIYWNGINTLSKRSPLVENRHYKSCHKIIASTIPYVGKELKILDKDFGNDNCVLILNELDFKKQYTYTETETQVIIQL